MPQTVWQNVFIQTLVKSFSVLAWYGVY